MLVLYVEDDADDAEIFKEIVGIIDSSIAVINAHDGLDALHYLESASVYPDLIFMDLNMPKLDGLACLKRIRDNSSFDHIPVIMFSTSANPKFEVESRSLGAKGYLKKPNSLSEGVTLLTKAFANVSVK